MRYVKADTLLQLAGVGPGLTVIVVPLFFNAKK